MKDDETLLNGILGNYCETTLPDTVLCSEILRHITTIAVAYWTMPSWSGERGDRGDRGSRLRLPPEEHGCLF